LIVPTKLLVGLRVAADRFYRHLPERSNSMATQQETKARPVHEVRLGRIRAAIWANETQNGTRHNVTVLRLYTDGDGNWRDSASFGRDDLPLLAKVADRAHTWIFEQAQEQNASRNPNANGAPNGKQNGSAKKQKAAAGESADGHF